MQNWEKNVLSKKNEQIFGKVNYKSVEVRHEKIEKKPDKFFMQFRREGQNATTSLNYKCQEYSLQWFIFKNDHLDHLFVSYMHTKNQIS